MIMAVYCGAGASGKAVSFTRTGHPLWYTDNRGWLSGGRLSYLLFPTSPAPTTYEAIWTAAGAACLDTPRLRDEDPAVGGRITAECRSTGHPLPRCGAWLSGWAPHGYGLSANP